ncbi:MAG: glycosyltransferase family 8 protein [Thermoguttaceae bacterium]
MPCSDNNPVVVCAADDRFAMPLGVMVRSALANLRGSAWLRLFILDGGISAENRRLLERSWPAGRAAVQWITAEAEALRDLPVSEHVTAATYFRVLIPRLLPASLDRAIYLDSDTVVLADLVRIWEEPFEGADCLAVQDLAAPYMDSELVLPNYRRCRPYLASVRPVPNYRQLGLSSHAKYFNAGVLLMDLARWRAADLTSRLLGCLREHRRHVLWWDQYALNVVLAGRWRELDLRWNQIAHLFAYPSWRQSPFDPKTFRQLRREPFIVHFASGNKPWHWGNSHPFRHVFYQYLDQTAWAGWRPQRPALDWGRLSRRFAEGYKRLCLGPLCVWKNRLRGKAA